MDSRSDECNVDRCRMLVVVEGENDVVVILWEQMQDHSAKPPNEQAIKAWDADSDYVYHNRKVGPPDSMAYSPAS